MSHSFSLNLPGTRGGALHLNAWRVNSGAGGGNFPTPISVSLLDEVSPRRSQIVEGLLLTTSTRGTLVDISNRGDFGTVEFETPLHAIITLPLAELRPAAR